MLRHDTPFANVMLWSTKENARIKSLSEACAEDLGMDVAELWELAQDREAWRAVVGNLRERLEPIARYRPVSSYTKTEVNKILLSPQLTELEKCEALQFYEEGKEQWPDHELLHIYCDGSMYRRGNHVGAGAAIVICQSGFLKLTSKEKLSPTYATPIRAELRAFLNALRMGSIKGIPVVIHVDAEHVWNF